MFPGVIPKPKITNKQANPDRGVSLDNEQEEEEINGYRLGRQYRIKFLALYTTHPCIIPETALSPKHLMEEFQSHIETSRRSSEETPCVA